MENNWITTTYEYAVILIFAFLSFISLFWCVLVLAKQQKLEHQSMLAEIALLISITVHSSSSFMQASIALSKALA